MIHIHIVGYIASHPRAMEWTNKKGEHRRAVVFVLSASSRYGNRLFDVFLISPAARRQARHLAKGKKLMLLSHNGIDFSFNPKINEWRPKIHADYIELFVEDKGYQKPDDKYFGVLDRWKKEIQEEKRLSKGINPKEEVLEMFSNWKKDGDN